MDAGPRLPWSPRQALGAQLPQGLQPGPERADPWCPCQAGPVPSSLPQPRVPSRTVWAGPVGWMGGWPRRKGCSQAGWGARVASVLGTWGQTSAPWWDPTWKGCGTPGRGEPSPTASRRRGTQGCGVGGGKAKRERKEIGACSAGPVGGGWRGSGHDWRCSAKANLAEVAGPPGGQTGWADCCARGGDWPEAAHAQSDVGLQLSGLGGVGVTGAPTPVPAGRRGAPAGDRLGSRRPTSWAPSSRGNRGRRGSSAPQGRSQHRAGSGCVGGRRVGR